MSKQHDQPKTDLSQIRQSIDFFDNQLHQTLIGRSKAIEQLKEAKKTAEYGSAFRPGREYDVLRNRASQHEGVLPFTAIENIWRIIISTFTYIQSPYSVHCLIRPDEPELRDMIRFNFGFSVPLHVYKEIPVLLESVSTSSGDLGIIPYEDHATAPWWENLYQQNLEIIAALPFSCYPTSPFRQKALIISKPVSEPDTAKKTLYSMTCQSKEPVSVIKNHIEKYCDIITAANTEAGYSLLVASFDSSAEMMQNFENSDQVPSCHILDINRIGNLPECVTFAGKDHS